MIGIGLIDDGDEQMTRHIQYNDDILNESGNTSCSLGRRESCHEADPFTTIVVDRR